MNYFKFLLLLTALASTACAHAKDRRPSSTEHEHDGGSHSGGGDVASNPSGGTSLLDLLEVDEYRDFAFYMESYDRELANAYDSLFSNSQLLSGSKYQDALAVLAACMGGNRLRSTYEPQPFYETRRMRFVFTRRPLEELNDEGAIRIENSSSRRQLAIQKNGVVIVQDQEFNSANFDNTSRAALQIHEGLVCAASIMNPTLLRRNNGTEQIRRFVRTLRDYAKSHINGSGGPQSGTFTPAESVRDAFIAIGFPQDPERVQVLNQQGFKIEILDRRFVSTARVRVSTQLGPTRSEWNRHGQRRGDGSCTATWTIDLPRTGVSATHPGRVVGGADRNDCGSQRAYDQALRQALRLVNENLSSLRSAWNRYMGIN